MATFVISLRATIRYYTLSGYFMSVVMNSIFMILTAWVIRNVVAPTGIPDAFHAMTGYADYLTFVVLGYSFNGFLIAAAARGGSTIYEEQAYGTVELLFLAPMSRFTWMLAKALSPILTSGLDLLVILSFGAAFFGLTINENANLGVALLGVGLTIIALEGISFIMAGVGMIFKQSHAIEVFLIPIFIFISGMMFPVDALPAWVRAFSYAFPVTYGLNVVRRTLIAGTPVSLLTSDFVGLVACAIVYIPAGYFLFRYLEKNAKKSGVLISF